MVVALEIILTILDIILPIFGISLAVWKIHGVTMKWYIINFLAAYFVAGIGRNIGVENDVQAQDIKFHLIRWFTAYIRVVTFTLTRMILFLYIFEIYSIYAFKMNFINILYKSKFRAIVFIHACAQIISIPATILFYHENVIIARVSLVFYFVTLVFFYLSSIIIIGISIYIAYENHSLRQNQRFKQALKPLIFYFLPITIMDLPAAALIIAPFLGVTGTAIGISVKTSDIFLQLRTTVTVLCTIFLLPPFRKALFDLLRIKKNQHPVTVTPLTNNFLSNRRNNM